MPSTVFGSSLVLSGASLKEITEGAAACGQYRLLWASPGPLHPGSGQEQPAELTPGRLRLSTEFEGCLVAGGIVRILQRLLSG